MHILKCTTKTALFRRANEEIFGVWVAAQICDRVFSAEKSRGLALFSGKGAAFRAYHGRRQRKEGEKGEEILLLYESSIKRSKSFY